MYVFEFFEDFPKYPKDADYTQFEYRLICSGELYNAEIHSTEWRKSHGTRFLLNEPFSLIVCSFPFDDYPQEIALKFSTPLVKIQKDYFTSMFRPDRDVANDLSAILSLFCRRLITVATKVREIHAPGSYDETDKLRDLPIGFLNDFDLSYWKRKPALVTYGWEGITDIIDYNPPPSPFKPHDFKSFISSLLSLPHRESFMRATRLYTLAMRMIEKEVDSAYLYLIASVESIANDEFKDFRPPRSKRIDAKRSVAKLAIQFGLNNEKAEELADEAAKGIPWARRKFCSFLLEYSTENLWEEDEIYHIPAQVLPTRDEFESAINQIYQARSIQTHSGKEFSPLSILGLGPTIPSSAIRDWDFREKPFPPIAWFERVVNNALVNYVLMKRNEDA